MHPTSHLLSFLCFFLLHGRPALSQPPPEYQANPNIGPGGSVFEDSPHFRIYDENNPAADPALQMLEAAHECFITDLGFRSTGLSFNSDDAPYYKTNVYALADAGSPGGAGDAGGVLKTDPNAGMGWLAVQPQALNTPDVTVHEFGHDIQYHSRTWVEQTNTGAWWEPFANWVADTYATSPLCESARQARGQSVSATLLDLPKLLSNSFRPLINAMGGPTQATYYEAWPFFTYLTNNPDSYSGLGPDTLRKMQVQYAPNSNETPLHTLQRILGNKTSVQDVVGRYWARMAYVDIGHPQGREVFARDRAQIDYRNVQPLEGQANRYTPIQGRGPQYMGANIIPLRATGGTVSVQLKAATPYRATLALSGGNGTRYVPTKGSGNVTVGQGEESSLVVANTPRLIQYDGFRLSGEVTAPLRYEFVLGGASVA